MPSPLIASRRASDGSELPANTRIPSVLGRGAATLGRGREVAALLLWTTSLFLVLALASYRMDAANSATMGAVGPNWVGPVGAWAARLLVSGIGVVSWVLPIELVLLGVPFVTGRPNQATPFRLASSLLIVLLAAALVQVGWPTAAAFGVHRASGLLGELFGELARSLFSTVGSFIVGLTSLGLILISSESFSFIALIRLLGRAVARVATTIHSVSRATLDAWHEARRIEREKREELRLASLPNVRALESVTPANDDDMLFEDDRANIVAEGDHASSDLRVIVTEPSQPLVRKHARRKAAVKESGAILPPANTSAVAPIADEPNEVASELESDVAPPDVDASELLLELPARKRKPRTPRGPQIVDTSGELEAEVACDTRARRRSPSSFQLPRLDLLIKVDVEPSISVDREQLYANSDKLVQTLANYGVQGKVEDILPGPTVTTYEVSPAPGTKVSKVASLADDLALALARKVRIVAPIPGKNRIGFELPNERRIPVCLRDLVEDRRFLALDAPLPVVLGRDILGTPVYADLASMPHVIVAGATGAGKSVGLNVMLTSLLFRRTPEELRLLMIDPKVVELAPFDRIPHMLLPVVTDMKQAATALKWAVDEMERRYQLFADAGTKNITTYNNFVGKVIRGDIKVSGPRMVMGKDHNGFADLVPAALGEQGTATLPEKLPFIVLVVDEFADLMMQQGKEVEAAVARLAQKARAAGMHVILATQRPSVDVITGMIKANFPTRMAYRVAQKVDSRTILDEQGAEHLLGRGDMLIKLNGTNETRRVQCPMITEEEVQAVTDHLRAQGEPVYDDNILKPRDDEGGEGSLEDAEQDPLYDDAIRIVADTRRCSTSWLQRKLGLGYNRAARIVEMMELRGLVGPANGAKDREVFVTAL